MCLCDVRTLIVLVQYAQRVHRQIIAVPRFAHRTIANAGGVSHNYTCHNHIDHNSISHDDLAITT